MVPACTPSIPLKDFISSSMEEMVVEVQFGILSPERIRAESVCQVTDTSLYVRQLPKPNGMNDLRMGTSDWTLNCSTCRNTIINCVGHSGHIELSTPVYHAGFVPTIVKILRCVCFFCSELLIPKEHPKTHGRFLNTSDKARLNLVSLIGRTRNTCPKCMGPQPNYTKVGNGIKHEFEARHVFGSSDEKEWALAPLDPARVRSMLEYITDESCCFLGLNPEFARPEWMVLTVLVVPPPIIRPSIKHSDDSRMRGQDDLTIHLQEILKTNIKVEEAQRIEGLAGENATAAQRATTLMLRECLQQLVAVYVYHDRKSDAVGGAVNSGSGPPHSNREKRLFHKRLKGKKGRIRGSLSGKRVNYCSRSVVSPDPTGDIDEVGVPMAVACKLTVPERVTAFNIEDLRARVMRGANVFHGASNVIEPDGTVRNLELIADRSSLMLEVGWIVERHLKDGDVVMFNRQPSLHKMSIMGHRVRIVDGMSFRLPICDTTAYNADFDGDEMNLHMSQTLEARAEQRELMSVTKQIVSAQSNKPIVSLVQDSLIAAYLMTLRDTFLTRDRFMQLTMSLRYPLKDMPPPAIIKPTALWTGKQLFSLLLPLIEMDKTVRNGQVAGIDKSSDGFMDIEERRVLIVQGELLVGTLCKKTLGNAAGGIIHILVNDLGHTIAANFIGDAQRLLVDYMEYRGFSVGISDCVSGKHVQNQVSGLIKRCFEASERIAREAVNAPARIVEGSITTMMSSMIAKGSAAVQQHMNWTNNINMMVTSGSKGSPINIAQIMACVGQQSVEGSRLKFASDGRTLPSYTHADKSPASRGFVSNSYCQGLTAQEYFFHAMGGREGLVDTAVKTAVTGYIQRRLIKALEGVMVMYDNTVRNPQGQLFHTLYGADGMDAVYIEKQTVPSFNYTDADMEARFRMHPELCTTTADTSVDVIKLSRAEVVKLTKDRDALRAAKFSIGLSDAFVFVPINAPRIILSAKYKFARCVERATMRQVVTERENMLRRIVKVRDYDATFYIVIYLRCHLATAVLMDAVGLKLEAVRWIFERVENMYMRSLVEPGEMVGTLAASSIGEPCTQMTLNTFHTAGVENKNMTLGVPRLKEIIDASAKPKTPCMIIPLLAPYNGSEKMARSIGLGMQYVKLSQVVAVGSVIRDPDPWTTLIDEDASIVSMHAALYGPLNEGGSCASATVAGGGVWIIRFILNREALVSTELTVLDVASALASYFGDDAEILRSEVNMVTWCVRIRLKTIQFALSSSDVTSPSEMLTLEEAAVKTVRDFIVDNVAIHGIPSITRSIVKQNDVMRVSETGGLVSRAEWIAETEGTNLQRVLSIDGVDNKRAISNDIHEVARVLGIEAAIAVMMDELRAVLSFDGGYVDDHHVQMLVYLMTQGGIPTAVTRHGLQKLLSEDVYQRASFEESMEVLLDAGGYGSRNRVNGVTSTVMLGQRMPAGTGICEILMQTHAAKKSVVVGPLDSGMALKAPILAMKQVTIPPMCLKTMSVKPVAPMAAHLPLLTAGQSATVPLFVGKQRKQRLLSLAHSNRTEAMNVVQPGLTSYCPSSPVIDYARKKEKYCPSSPLFKSA